MSCSCFSPSVAQPSATSQDPTKHVNYELGMVLGVDDLNQEFAYHSQRAQWMARDVLGYGTVWGLAVSKRDDGAPRGPEVVVSSGVAINPRGQMIRVAPAQCASLNQWLAARTDDVLKRRVPTASPNVFDLPLYLVLSYRECLTDPVPIAGEPCRSETDTTKPSRAADDFLLELSFDPPAQQEEDAVRQFVAWLQSHITVTAGGAPSLSIADFLAEIRVEAAAAAAQLVSPPGGPEEVLLDVSPPFMLTLPAAQLGDYLRAALRLWVTELRAEWRPSWMGDKHGCAGDDVLSAADQGNQVLLAALTVPIVPPGLGQPGWTVTSAADVVVVEDARPWLLHLRLLQELLLARAAPPAGPVVVAAGVVRATKTLPTTRSIQGGLAVTGATDLGTANQLTVAFSGYNQPPTSGGPQYLVKTLAWPSAPLLNLTVSFAGFQAGGFLLQVSKGGASLATAELDGLQLMIEVSQYP